MSNKQLKELLNKGYSGSAIAKKLHIRKQDALAEIRKIQNKEINKAKLTNPAGQKGKPLSYSSERFAEELFKEGYTVAFISKLVNAKHSETSQNAVKKYLKGLKTKDTDALKSHKANMKFYKATGKYKQHLDAKFYRETAKHYNIETGQFVTGSPIIEL